MKSSVGNQSPHRSLQHPVPLLGHSETMDDSLLWRKSISQPSSMQVITSAHMVETTAATTPTAGRQQVSVSRLDVLHLMESAPAFVHRSSSPSTAMSSSSKRLRNVVS